MEFRRVHFRSDHTRIGTTAQGFYPFQVINPQLNAAVAELRSHGKRTVRTSNEPFDKETFWGVSNTTTIDIGSVTLKNIFGYRYKGVSNFQDATRIANAQLPARSEARRVGNECASKCR